MLWYNPFRISCLIFCDSQLMAPNHSLSYFIFSNIPASQGVAASLLPAGLARNPLSMAANPRALCLKPFTIV